MGYDVSTVCFYGVEIEPVDSDRWEELFATNDGYFLYTAGADSMRNFIVMDKTLVRMAYNKTVETEVFDFGEMLLTQAMTGDLNEGELTRKFCEQRELTPIGYPGWYAVVSGH